MLTDSNWGEGGNDQKRTLAGLCWSWYVQIGTEKLKLEKLYGAVALNQVGDRELELGWGIIIVRDIAERYLSFDFAE